MTEVKRFNEFKEKILKIMGGIWILFIAVPLLNLQNKISLRKNNKLSRRFT